MSSSSLKSNLIGKWIEDVIQIYLVNKQLRKISQEYYVVYYMEFEVCPGLRTKY